jgi:LmbE family N-acetylglucosaminyl deacetylase
MNSHPPLSREHSFPIRAPGLSRARKQAVPAFLLLVALPLLAQRPFTGAPEILHALDRLSTVGSVLMIAAHPDDENTALLAYFARGRHLRTAYLSITRGEGGQNLIGPEQGHHLGVIRTQELLQARRIDGAEQLFTSAVDFGYSKTAEETFAKWGREKVLGEMVLAIRTFRPDIIVLRFSGTSRDGHGHHQASAILGKEAFLAAADPARFREQLPQAPAWAAKRIFWNAFNWNDELEREAGRLKDKLELDVGIYDPALGYSYAEIAGLSRSMHRSQAFGAPQRKGPVPERLVLVAGAPAAKDPLEGVPLHWSGVPGGKPVGLLLDEARRTLDPSAPHKIVPTLLRAREALQSLEASPLRRRKLAELDNAVALACGLWLDASAPESHVIEGSPAAVTLTAINRSPCDVQLVSANGVTLNRPLKQNELVREKTQLPPGPVAFRVLIGGVAIEYERSLVHRFVDRMYGETIVSVSAVPAVSVAFPEPAVLFPESAPRKVSVEVVTQAPSQSGAVSLDLPPGWTAVPASVPYSAPDKGARIAAHFDVTPPVQPAAAVIRAHAGPSSTTVKVLDYPHIPAQTVFEPAEVRLVRADVKTLVRNIGYVMGAGDSVPRALEQMGCTVTLLSPADLATGDLDRFDAIVTGVRAFNVRPDLVTNQSRLYDYVRRGGTLVAQYNTLEWGREQFLIGPHKLEIGRSRVSVEEAPIETLNAGAPLLSIPNRIAAEDWEGWIQERGLYFPKSWSAEYTPVVATNDPGEKPLQGGILAARHGRGVFVYTSFSWFRQLPAGVPGAYRIFANLISAGRALADEADASSARTR